MKRVENPLEDAVAAYALDALEPEEQKRFEAEASREQKELADQWSQVGAALGQSIPAEQPPAALKERVMRQIQATPQLNRVPRHAAGGVDTLEEDYPSRVFPVVSEHDSSGPADGKSLNQLPPNRLKARIRWNVASGVVAAACAGLAVFAGVWGMDQKRQLDATRSELSAAQAQSSSSTSVIGQLSAASDLSLAKGNMDGANISVMYSASHNMAGVATNDLPKLPEGKVYMMWLMDKDHQVIGKGALNSGETSDSASGGEMTTMTDQDLRDVAAFGVTVENKDATSPTGDPFMLESES
ncbi:MULTISPECIES: anti-sigma factor domain-containing protein [Micrococcaceae]|uniref:anti-sigma factor domain-containing protein n=1 Tax=unclassified Kocuria TaxID=2649579 RepID=UPI0010132BB4|nr:MULTISPECIES: anti-sigma factor [unclassified Kocuria]